MSDTPLPFYANRLLFGRAGVPGHLACAPGDATVRFYSRDGETQASDAPFRPFLLLADPDLLKDSKGDLTVTPLDGPGVYRWLAEFSSWFQCLKARDHCRNPLVVFWTWPRAVAPAARANFYLRPRRPNLLLANLLHPGPEGLHVGHEGLRLPQQAPLPDGRGALVVGREREPLVTAEGS